MPKFTEADRHEILVAADHWKAECDAVYQLRNSAQQARRTSHYSPLFPPDWPGLRLDPESIIAGMETAADLREARAGAEFDKAVTDATRPKLNRWWRRFWQNVTRFS